MEAGKVPGGIRGRSLCSDAPNEGVPMETKTHNPSFTVSLRGYDREEVDDYLDSLAEALEQVDSAEEHTRKLQSHINRLNARIKELEDRLSSEKPRSGLAVGDRIGILLRQAEETAEETVMRAEARAAEIVTAAEQRAESAEQLVRSATSRAEEQARRIEAAARAEACDIVAEADSRAAARTRQIEQWAEQVISHTRAEEARMVAEQKAARETFEAEMSRLAAERTAAHRTLNDLRDSLATALAIIPAETEEEPMEEVPAAADESAVSEPEPPATVDSSDALAEDAHPTVPAGSEDDDEDYEEKLEAWVNWTSENGSAEN
jgi:DivIVA domain-containing protein